MKKKYIATIGVFDGIHLGHKFILEKLKKEASQFNFFSLVITFDISPKKILFKNFYGYLIDIKEKEKIIKLLNINHIWVLKTSKFLLNLSGKKFIQFILKYFSIYKFIIGEDFHFGKKGKNDINYLKKLSRKYNFKLTIIKKIKKRGIIISSTLIRKLIKAAQFKDIKTFLGRNYILKGRVIKGRGYGRELGFPTVNIDPFDYVLPRVGIYAAYVIIGKTVHLGAFNVGRRPTVTNSNRVVLEGHIIDFSKNILGRIIKVIFLEKSREEKKFSSLGELKEAINRDIDGIRKKYSSKLRKFIA